MQNDTVQHQPKQFFSTLPVRFDINKTWTEPQFILPGVRRGELAVLAAAGATGKSYLSQMFCMSVATGVRVFPFLPVETPRRVLLVQMEDLAVDLENRGNAILRAYPRMAVGSLANLVAHAIPGESLSFVRTSDSGVPLEDTALVKMFCDVCVDYDLIVLDPLTNLWDACDENDQRHAMLLMKALRKIAVQSDAAILVCHHVNKNSMFLGRSSEAAAVRGSGAIVNAPRCVMTLASTKEDAQADTLLSWPKLNNHALIAPVPLFRGWRGVLFMSEAEAVDSIERKDAINTDDVIVF